MNQPVDRWFNSEILRAAQDDELIEMGCHPEARRISGTKLLKPGVLQALRRFLPRRSIDWQAFVH